VSQMPPPVNSFSHPQGRQFMAPHRGGLVLALGILGIVACFICGIVAWVMGNGDLKAMDNGTMDPSGRSITNAGRICGIIGTCIACAGLLVYCGIGALAMMGMAAGAAGAGRAP
jgi:hypothetical protein